LPHFEPEFAFEQLLKHESTIRAAAGTNEATTRLRAIDTVLFDVLGWEKQEVETEKYFRSEGYADYTFLDGKSFLLVLEAKKAGETFLLKENHYSDSPVGFPLIAQQCKEADQALRQVLGYAAQVAPRYIAISNGHQWLIALAWVSNQTIDERSVFVFESVDAIKAKFARFWACFSPEGVRKNQAAAHLLESRKAPAPAKLSQRLAGYPEPAARNTLVNEIDIITTGVLEEVKKDEEDEQFLNECYIEPESTSGSLAYASELLVNRLDADERIAAQVVDSRDVAAILHGHGQEKPVVVLGRVGHGKSTFLRYLRKIRSKELLNKYFQIEINFIDRPEAAELVAKFVYDEIERQFRENYNITLTDANVVRGALHNDLDRFSRSVVGRAHEVGSEAYKAAELQFILEIQKDRHLFLQKVLLHFRAGRNSSIAIFFDNLDRRNEKIQEEAFLRASAIARDFASLVFVCLRPSTFYNSKKVGVLDSISPKVINVVSPKTHTMVVKRLRFARRIALGEVPMDAHFSRKFSMELPRTALFLECIANSFYRSKHLSNIFDLVSNGNARDLLTLVAQVLTSQHLDTGKILKKYQEGGYLLSDHEVLRALLYGNFLQYDPGVSLFVNLFDIQRADAAEHFTKFAILDHLRRAPDGHPNFGFTPVDLVLRYLYQVGFSEECAKEAIRFLFAQRCCEANIPVEVWSDSIEEIRLTPHGRFHVTDLVKRFQYMDAITIDTPIVDDAVRAGITAVDDIQRRLSRCETFIDYLQKCSDEIRDVDFRKSWGEVVVGVAADIQNVYSSLKGHPRK
jgi:hypothetical protein